MFTIFFGGNHFAPNTKYEGKTLQDFLMEHYIACYQHLAKRLKDCKAVIGFEAMNEPHTGFIGMHDLGILSGKRGENAYIMTKNTTESPNDGPWSKRKC